MLNEHYLKKSMLLGLICCYSFSLQAALPGSPTSPSTKPTLQSPPPPKIIPIKPHPHPLIKPELPPMHKPFGMPGVVGLQRGRWEGTDYLGFLSNNIGISVEILKDENVPQISSPSTLESLVANAFIKEGINPHAEATEGPPLPFLHVLILVYAADKDRFVILGNGRLFEQIQVFRKDFIPSGFWQGITWENQDVANADERHLDIKLRGVAEKIASDFATRYRQYNLSGPGMSGLPNSPNSLAAPTP